MIVFVFFLILFGSRITEKLGLDFRVSLEREGIRSRKNEIVFCCDLGFCIWECCYNCAVQCTATLTLDHDLMCK